MKQDTWGRWQHDHGGFIPRSQWPKEDHPTQSINAQIAAATSKTKIAASGRNSAAYVRPRLDDEHTFYVDVPELGAWKTLACRLWEACCCIMIAWFVVFDLYLLAFKYFPAAYEHLPPYLK